MGWALRVDGVGDGGSEDVGRGAARSAAPKHAPPLPTWLTVFGQSGFIAPGGAMNLYLGGAIGMAWVIGVMVWGRTQLRATPAPHIAAEAPSWT